MSTARCLSLLLFHLIHLCVALHGDDDMQGFHRLAEPKEQIVPPSSDQSKVKVHLTLHLGMAEEDLKDLQVQQSLSIQNQAKATATDAEDCKETGANCAELLDKGMTQSGVYTITLEGFPDGVSVYCDQVTDGGGWTVFLQRNKYSFYPLVNFVRTFEEYATGFGNLNTEFWLGNRILHSMTRDGPFTLRVEGKRIGHDDVRFGLWETFSVGSEESKFTLSLGGYSSESTLGDALLTLSSPKDNANGMGFSTLDQDNDSNNGHCSLSHFGRAGWWFSSCGHTSPAGPFGDDTLSGEKAYWYYWEPTTVGSPSLISEIQFKIRPPLQ